MAANNPDDSEPKAETSTEWPVDPTATVPGINLGDIWDEDLNKVREAMGVDDGDWRAVAKQETPDSEAKKRIWNAESGSWQIVEKEIPFVPDPTAFTAQMPRMKRSDFVAELKEEDDSFGFESDDGELPESEPPEGVEEQPKKLGFFAQILAKFGF